MTLLFIYVVFRVDITASKQLRVIIMNKNVHLIECEASFTFDFPPVTLDKFLKEFSVRFAYTDVYFDKVLRQPDQVTNHVSGKRLVRIKLTVFGKQKKEFFNFLKYFLQKNNLALVSPPQDLKAQIPKELCD